MNQTATQRYCPVCSTVTTDLHCPQDGVSTVLRQRFQKDATAYEPGDVVASRYRITGTLGRGAFGAVYAAKHTGTDQECAIKMLALSSEAAENQDVVKRFFQEARVTAGLRHPNTVRVFDVGQAEEGPLFLAMEMLKGPSLSQYLMTLFKRHETMTEAATLDIAIPILKSLSEAHAAGLVHRDIKPGNIILSAGMDGDTVIKVLDFGIARTVDSSITATGKSLGTPAYMSPEQCKGMSLDGRSDLYSLAVVLFLCVAGRLPFASNDPLALMFMHCNEEPPEPTEFAKCELSDDFVEVFAKSLSKKQDDRYADAKEMRLTLEGIRGGAWAGTPQFGVDTLTSFEAIAQGLEKDKSDLENAATAEAVDQASTVKDPATQMSTDTNIGDQPTAAAIKTTNKRKSGVVSPLDTSTVASSGSPSAEASSSETSSGTTWTGDTSAGKRSVLPWVVTGLAVLGAGGYALLGGEIPESHAPPAKPATAQPAAPSKPVATKAKIAEKPKPVPAKTEPAEPTAPVSADVEKDKALTYRQLEAKVAWRLALKSDSMSEKLAFARQAVRLAPDNANYSSKLAEMEAEFKLKKRMKGEQAKAAAKAKAKRRASAAKKPKPQEGTGELQPQFAD